MHTQEKRELQKDFDLFKDKTTSSKTFLFLSFQITKEGTWGQSTKAWLSFFQGSKQTTPLTTLQ